MQALHDDSVGLGSPDHLRDERVGRAADSIDATCWFLASVVFLVVARVGRVSGDGLVQTQAYLTGSWQLNPNHLLYEPLGAAWLKLAMHFPGSRAPVDRMVFLSAIAGAVSVALFRRLIAHVAATRVGANAATAFMGFCAAFLSLWLSSEVQMVQMPWLVLGFAAAWAFAERPRLGSGVAVGLAIGVATLFYVSNVILAFAIPAVLSLGVLLFGQRYSLRQLIVIPMVTLAVAAVGLLAAWRVTAPGASLVGWLTAYGGGHGSVRIAATYGIHGIRELPTAIARGIYGTALELVDVSGAVADLRTTHSLTVESISAIAICLTAAVVIGYSLRKVWRTPSIQPQLLVVLAWLLAVFAFGVFWNNSDDQFYFQMSIAFGALIALGWQKHRASWLSGAIALVVIWNGVSAWRYLIHYPRDQYVAWLTQSTAGRELVLFPGSDELMELMYFVPAPSNQKRLNITSIAGTVPATVGIPSVVNDIACALSKQERVVSLDFAVPGRGDSWRALALLGYDRDRVLSALSTFPVGQEHTFGPFVARDFSGHGDNARCVQDSVESHAGSR